MNGCRTRLVYHVDEGLCVVPKEATDRVIILAGDDRLNEGGKFI